uniref:Apple domain-containing protein n=1 Tax=Plectus sambesii TaxID=2011161 RepID=A0A914W109_9BILA
MVRGRNHFYFVKLHVILLLLIYDCRLHAAVLTYDGCMSDSTNSYKLGGWCFLFYRNSSWAVSTPTQDGAQTVCHPHGNLAVGVTYKMLETYKTKYTSSSVLYGWLALLRNGSSVATVGWIWKTLLPNGKYATFPAIMSNIPWGPIEPNNLGGREDRATLRYTVGVIDVPNDIAVDGSYPLAVICQFAPQKWTYTQRGHGLFTNAAYRIAQMTAVRDICIRQCHWSVFCISVAFNPTTNDCQIYAVSPEDSRFSGSVTASSTYEWHIRDGMEY